MKPAKYPHSQTSPTLQLLSALLTNRTVAAGCLLALLAVPARAVDRPVPSVTYPTIAAAVAAAQAGDRILVAPGIYQEHVVSAVPRLQFIGRASVWDGTLSNGTPGVCLTATGDSNVVQGFTFRAGQASVAQVQLTGNACRVLKCSSRGPAARFLRITGNSALVDSCSLFAVDSTAIEIIGDGAVVKKLKTLQCDNFVVRVQGNGAMVTSCAMSLSDDNHSINISGNDATVSLNTFRKCDAAISITGSNAVVMKNKALHNGGVFLNVTGSDALVDNNSIIHCANTFVSVTGTNGVVTNNRATFCTGTFLSVTGSDAVIRNNRASYVAGTFFSVNSDNAVVENNRGAVAGSASVTGDNITVRGNTVSDAPNDKNGLTTSSRTAAGGGLIENNRLKDIAAIGLILNCHNTVIRGNRVTNAGTEGDEGACLLSGHNNDLTNNVVMAGGAHGFNIEGTNNILDQCSAIDSAADGFHITGDVNALVRCMATLCTGEGLDNGATDTTVISCTFKRNRLDVANDGTFANAGTFIGLNVFTTGGPTQPPQVD